MKIDKKKIISEANMLLDEMGVLSLPINPFEILDFIDLGYASFKPSDLQFKDTDPNEVSAFISYTRNLVLYNENHGANRTRFSLAHEIGHSRLGHQSIPHPPNYDSKSKPEIEANLFASELLMPTKSINEFINDRKLNIPDISNRFGVSRQAVTYRLDRERAIPSGYDYISKSANYKQPSETELEADIYSKLYPIEGYEEDCDFETAYEYYIEIADDIPDLKRWVLSNGYEDEYENMFRAIEKISEELD